MLSEPLLHRLLAGFPSSPPKVRLREKVGYWIGAVVTAVMIAVVMVGIVVALILMLSRRIPTP